VCLYSGTFFWLSLKWWDMLGDAPMCASTLGFANLTCDVINGGNHSSDVEHAFSVFLFSFFFFYLLYSI
jgi:hypothetical protein